MSTLTLGGLNRRALYFLADNVIKQSRYKWKTFPGKFGFPGYELRDGTIVYEKKCGEIFCTCPYIFTNLVRENGSQVDPELDWTDEDVYDYVYGLVGC